LGVSLYRLRFALTIGYRPVNVPKGTFPTIGERGQRVVRTHHHVINAVSDFLTEPAVCPTSERIACAT
jgi:hypothetical protein